MERGGGEIITSATKRIGGLPGKHHFYVKTQEFATSIGRCCCGVVAWPVWPWSRTWNNQRDPGPRVAAYPQANPQRPRLPLQPLCLHHRHAKHLPNVERYVCSRRRPTTAATTTTAWGGTCEIITLNSGDRRQRNELADRAKRLRILAKYDLAPMGKGKTRGGGGGKGSVGDGNAGEYDDDGFEGEVSSVLNLFSSSTCLKI